MTGLPARLPSIGGVWLPVFVTVLMLSPAALGPAVEASARAAAASTCSPTRGQSCDEVRAADDTRPSDCACQSQRPSATGMVTMDVSPVAVLPLLDQYAVPSSSSTVPEEPARRLPPDDITSDSPPPRL
jgi:hypothetical protein